MRLSKGEMQLNDGAFALWTPNSTERCQYIPYTTIYGTTTETHFLNDEHTISLTFNRNTSSSECNKNDPILSQQGLVFRFINTFYPNARFIS